MSQDIVKVFLTVTQNVKNCFDKKRLKYQSNIQETEGGSSHQHNYRPGWFLVRLDE